MNCERTIVPRSPTVPHSGGGEFRDRLGADQDAEEDYYNYRVEDRPVRGLTPDPGERRAVEGSFSKDVDAGEGA